MAELTAELPDPAGLSSAAVEPGGADDLLSKLAGAEIDRLIAEADGDAPPVGASGAVAAAAVDSAPPGPSIPVMEAQLDQLFSQIESGDSADSAAPAARAVSPPQTASESASAASISAITAAVDSARDSADALAQTATGPADDESINELERQAIASMDVEIRSHDVDSVLSMDDLQGPQSETPVGKPPRELPAWVGVLLRPLEMINAPLDDYSPAVRATLGRVAIATLVNAVAILVYVLMFRHKS
jgi:hypothetical protein